MAVHYKLCSGWAPVEFIKPKTGQRSRHCDEFDFLYLIRIRKLWHFFSFSGALYDRCEFTLPEFFFSVRKIRWRTNCFGHDWKQIYITSLLKFSCCSFLNNQELYTPNPAEGYKMSTSKTLQSTPTPTQEEALLNIHKAARKKMGQLCCASLNICNGHP